MRSERGWLGPPDQAVDERRLFGLSLKQTVRHVHIGFVGRFVGGMASESSRYSMVLAMQEGYCPS